MAIKTDQFVLTTAFTYLGFTFGHASFFAIEKIH